MTQPLDMARLEINDGHGDSYFEFKGSAGAYTTPDSLTINAGTGNKTMVFGPALVAVDA